MSNAAHDLAAAAVMIGRPSSVISRAMAAGLVFLSITVSELGPPDRISCRGTG